MFSALKGFRCDSWEAFEDGSCDNNKEEIMGINATPPSIDRQSESISKSWFEPMTMSESVKVFLKTKSQFPYCWEN